MTETMTVADELAAQLDAVRFGTWVQRPPILPGEACAVVRRDSSSRRMLSTTAIGLVYDAIKAILPEIPRRYPLSVTTWNDHCATREQVIEVLDQTWRRAKELGI